MLSTLPYTAVLSGADRMALALADESYGRFTADEFVSFGQRYGMPERAILAMLGEVSSSVRHRFRTLNQPTVIDPDVAVEIERRADTLAR